MGADRGYLSGREGTRVRSSVDILEAGKREAMRGLSQEEVATLINLLQRGPANAEEMERREVP